VEFTQVIFKKLASFYWTCVTQKFWIYV